MFDETMFAVQTSSKRISLTNPEINTTGRPGLCMTDDDLHQLPSDALTSVVTRDAYLV